jgi:hypothetical protein
VTSPSKESPLAVDRFYADDRFEARPVEVRIASVWSAVYESFIVYRAYVYCMACAIAERDAHTRPRARSEAFLDLVVSHS